MKGNKFPFFVLAILILGLLVACGNAASDWTIPSKTPEDCEYGKRIIKFPGEIQISPQEGQNTVLWASYNGIRCGEKVGEAVGGRNAQWFQIVENVSGEMLINVSAFETAKQDTWPGWVYCSDVAFPGGIEGYKDKVTATQYELVTKCNQASHQ